MIEPLITQGISLARHSIRRTLSVICVLAVIGFLGLGVKRILYPPKTESYAQHVEAGGNINNIEIYNPEDTFFLGVKVFGLKLGISKPMVKKIKEITEEIKGEKPDAVKNNPNPDSK
jgi:hypothetical protein